MKEVKIKSFDNLDLHTYIYDEVKKPIGVIQFIHGMQEHAGRYDEVCKFFNKHNYICLASDLRGHGKTAKDIQSLGISDGDIFSETVQDQITITKYIQDNYPDLPIYIFGHSYGSFITQKYIQEYHVAKKAIICGTTNGDNLIMKFGKIVAKMTKWKNGKHGKATMIENMSFKNYAKGFENGNWLSRDEDVWTKYKEDKYCGTPFPVSFYSSLFRNMGQLNKGIANIPNDIEILLIYGTADPVGNKGKEIEKLYKKYQKNGKNVKLIAYPDARHELLNETNKTDVMTDVLKFLS